MGNLSAHCHSSSSAAASPNPSSPSADPLPDPIHLPDGYLSDDPTHASCSSKRRADRKKGTPWTEEEHRLFLLGLQKLGKGDWRGISRNFVLSRTPTQVASHAQKYFIRQCSATRRKRRSSLFDMAPDMATDLPLLPEDEFMLPPRAEETDKVNSPPSLNLSLKPDSESMEASPSDMVEDTKDVSAPLGDLPPAIPALYPAYLPIPFPLWPLNASPLEKEEGAETSHHQVLKPIPIFPKEPVNVDELVGMSQLSLKESVHIEPSPLSLKLLGEPSRLSAFHASIPVSVRSDVYKGDGDGNPRNLNGLKPTGI